MKKSYLFLLFLPLAALPSCKSDTLTIKDIDVTYDETAYYNSGDKITRDLFNVKVTYSNNEVKEVNDFTINNADSYVITYKDTLYDSHKKSIYIGYIDTYTPIDINLLTPTSQMLLEYEYKDDHFEVRHSDINITELIIPGLFEKEVIGGENIIAPVTNIAMSGTDAGGFEGCTSLESVILPSTFTEISKRAFKGCTALKTIQFPTNDGYEIMASAFEGCTSLEDIYIDSCTYLHNDSFCGCENLSNVEFDKKLETIGERAFKGAGSSTEGNELGFLIPENSALSYIGISAFESTTNMESFVVPALVTEIANNAFDSSGVTSVVFKNTVGWKINNVPTEIYVGSPSTNATNLKNCTSGTDNNWGYTGIVVPKE